MGNPGILRSSFGVSLATLLSRVLGLVRVMFEARVLGGGSVASAWFLAFAIPNLFRRLLGEGALGTALIPVVSQIERDHGSEQVRRDLAVVFSALSLVLAAVVIVVSGAAWLLRRLFEPGGALAEQFPVLGSERIQLALWLLPLLMPYAFFICLIGVVGAVLNTRRVFVLPALGALLLNLFLIGGLAAAFLRGVEPAHLPEFLPVLAVLVLLSGMIQLLLMLFLLHRQGRFPLLSRKSFRNTGVLKQLWTLVLPNMLSGAALQVSFLVDRSLAICLGPQAVPALTNVDRLVDLPIGIFAIALSSVLMVNMSHSAARGDQTEIAESLIFSLRHVYFICIPMAALMVGFWEPMIRLLCLGGNYTESDLEATRFVAIFYGAGIPAFCAIKMLLPVFYARRKMLIPLYSSLTAIVVNLVLNLILMWHLRQGGIALATVLSSMLNNFILYRCLRREGFDLQPGVLGRTFLRSLVLAAATAGVLHLLYPCWRTALTFRGVGELPAFLLLLLLFGGLYLGGSLLCRAPEVRELFSLLRRRRAA